MSSTEILLNGEIFVKKQKETESELPYVIVRTYSAGVHAGYLKERIGKEVTLVNARRMWYWAGAMTLSQLAMEGTKKPGDCKFPMAVESIILTEAIEIIPCTNVAKNSIESVKEFNYEC